MREPRVIGALDACFAWSGSELYEAADLATTGEALVGLRGAAAFAGPTPDGRGWRIIRDPLGLAKLFWSAADGEVAFAARPSLLVEEGWALDEIAAVPRGLAADIDPEVGDTPAPEIPQGWSRSPNGGADVGAAAREIRRRLDGYLDAVREQHPAVPVFVCLSGGLDSTGIAVLVARRFPDAVAVSFDLERPGGAPSEDRQTAIRVAADLGLPLLEASVTVDELLEPLDTVLREGIDWRDFNVHAGLVNAALARAIADSAAGAEEPPLVFTGDLANEFLVDYQPERYRDRTYYRLPDVGPTRLRSLLVKGLDSCHREIGIFEAWGQRLVQPYAVAIDSYMGLPESFLRLPDRKERLCGMVFGGGIPDYVMSRPKSRAQVGDATTGKGVLAACVDRGIDSAALRRRFAELHSADERSLDGFIRAGRYRARVPDGGYAHAR
jgi:asparagine synthetase B (glutamine-hydrolysing)